MNKKELSEIKKNFSDDCGFFTVNHVVTAFVDAENYLMFRCKYPMPGDYFKATDSNGSVGTVGTPINMEV